MYSTYSLKETTDMALAHPARPNSPLECGQQTYLQRASSSLKANVFVAKMHERCVVIKDYSSSHVWVRNTLCKWLLHREMLALSKLTDYDGVPRVVGKYGRFGFAMARIEGKTLNRQMLERDTSLIPRIAAHIHQIHARGVTHNDIRVRNMLLDSSGNLSILDFGAAIQKPASHQLLGRALFYLARFSDQLKIVKLKQQFQPNTLTRKEQHLAKYVTLSKLISWVWKKHIYKRLPSQKR